MTCKCFSRLVAIQIATSFEDPSGQLQFILLQQCGHSEGIANTSLILLKCDNDTL